MTVDRTFEAAYDVISQARAALANPDIDDFIKARIHIRLAGLNRDGVVDVLDQVYGDAPLSAPRP